MRIHQKVFYHTTCNSKTMECFLPDQNLMRFCLLFLLLHSHNVTNAQFNLGQHVGLQTGLVVHIGTHVQGIGIQLNAYYQHYFYQVNSGSSLVRFGKSYGKRKSFWEFRQAFGGYLMYGRKELEPDWWIDPAFHQSAFNNAIGYQYIWYWDQAHTNQRSGAWMLHFGHASILFENDVFAGQAKDRFRTGHLQVSWRKDFVRVMVGLNIWTGETGNSTWQHISMPKCPSGFRLLEDLPYGKTSHGNLYGGLAYSLGYGQLVQWKTGIDSEHVRHAFQNRFTHDLILLPKSMERNTPHYPRLDEDGCPVFQKEKVRKTRIYSHGSLNGYWSN
jgi:hypothetical protein